MRYTSRFFKREEFERALYGLVAKADYQLAAASLGASPKILSQYLNPNEIRESLLFRAAAILAAWIEIDAARGREMLRRFVAFVERALPEADSSPSGVILASVEKAEVELAEVKRMAATMPMRQVAQAMVAGRYERRKAA